MVELLLGLLPLEDQWRDSAAVLSITTSGRTVIPVELMMVGREEIGSDPAMMRLAHVVALRSEQRSVLYWVDAETGAVLRMQQLVPAHVGSLLEYRARPATPPPAP
jgi:hypothetical protein